MGRPPMPVGTYGKITLLTLDNGDQEARTRFRDYDGETRQVRAVGKTKSAAERNLKAKIRDRQGPAGTVITADTRLNDLADAWLAASHSPEWSTNTRDTYAYVVSNNVKPALGALRIGEVKVSTINRALDVIKDRHGLGSAKTTKSALSGMFKHAITHEACDSNPVRDATSIPRKRSVARALTVEQTDYLVDHFRSSELAVTHDLPDLIEWMLYTGCRIGEACATRDSVLSIDGDLGTWEVNATVVREKGRGLIVQEWTKTEAGWRVLALPPGAVEMIRRRRTEVRFKAPHGIVFGAPAARALRDPKNTNRAMRQVLDGLDCDVCDRNGLVDGIRRDGKPGKVRCDKGPYSWVTSHTFRKTVATRLDDAGASGRQVADQLGHARASMTQDVYMGRNVVNAAAAQILDR